VRFDEDPEQRFVSDRFTWTEHLDEVRQHQEAQGGFSAVESDYLRHQFECFSTEQREALASLFEVVAAQEGEITKDFCSAIATTFRRGKVR